MTSPILLSLADRVESLTKACRETDALIWWHINRKAAEIVYWNAAPGLPRQIDAMPDGIGKRAVMCNAPAYTASLDTAMTLVPENHMCSIDKNADGSGCATVSPDYRDMDKLSSSRKCATPALALTAASLRARSALEASHG